VRAGAAPIEDDAPGGAPARLRGWGGVPTLAGREIVAEDLSRAAGEATLLRGLGRSYGDASLPASPAQPVASTRRADRLVRFEAATGVLRAEAGFSLVELNRLFWPRGFCSPVSPGTEHVTLGGMVASDVHGKNHHGAGSFGRHVRALRLRVADGRELEIGDHHERALFRATIGGMGLTGHVLEVEVALQRIPSPWIVTETRRARDLDDLVDGLAAAGRTWGYTAGWIDTLAPDGQLGRGLLIQGRWAEPSEAPARPPSGRGALPVPFLLPSATISWPLVRAFNEVYLALNGRRRGPRVVDPRTFFYPLDVARDWHRLYGRAGFVQHQCVIPAAAGRDVVRRLLALLKRPGCWSALAVLKDFGAEGKGLISFPCPGITLALDFPMRGERTRALVDEMNELVLAAGGRIYLTKDALSRPEHVRAMDPRLDEFLRLRAQWDPARTIRSAQSVRLFGDPA
jgi:FAD/FMN-containing dehydrogenase